LILYWNFHILFCDTVVCDSQKSILKHFEKNYYHFCICIFTVTVFPLYNWIFSIQWAGETKMRIVFLTIWKDSHQYSLMKWKYFECCGIPMRSCITGIYSELWMIYYSQYSITMKNIFWCIISLLIVINIYLIFQIFIMPNSDTDITRDKEEIRKNPTIEIPKLKIPTIKEPIILTEEQKILIQKLDNIHNERSKEADEIYAHNILQLWINLIFSISQIPILFDGVLIFQIGKNERKQSEEYFLSRKLFVLFRRRR